MTLTIKLGLNFKFHAPNKQTMQSSIHWLAIWIILLIIAFRVTLKNTLSSDWWETVFSTFKSYHSATKSQQVRFCFPPFNFSWYHVWVALWEKIYIYLVALDQRWSVLASWYVYRKHTVGRVWEKLTTVLCKSLSSCKRGLKMLLLWPLKHKMTPAMRLVVLLSTACCQMINNILLHRSTSSQDFEPSRQLE